MNADVELVDLSVPIVTGMPVYPGDPEVTIGPALTAARDGVNVLAVHMGSQSGTHVDAPYHLDDALPDLDALPLERFAGPAHVVDARGAAPRSPIGPEALEGVTGRIVLVATGWSAHWGTPAYPEHPYLTEEAARLLVERGVHTVGIDALSVDPTPAEDFPAHRVLCGAHAVIAPKDRAVALTPAAAKVASGAAETVPYLQVTNLARTLRELQEANVWVMGADQAAPVALAEARLDGATAFVLGAEGEGLRRLTRETCDQLLRIPMHGRVESLNVSVAAGICLYECRRQRAGALSAGRGQV